MKKIILFIVLCLMPFALMGQSSNVRMVVDKTANTVTFWRGNQQLSISGEGLPTVPTYYVKTGGDDANTGLSDAQAWAHHPWMSTWTGSVTLAPGDVVSMKRGDTWSASGLATAYMVVGQSGAADAPITTNAYGTGAKPIIKISDDSHKNVIEGYGKSYITFDNLDIQHFEAAVDVASGQNGIAFGKDAGPVTPHDWIITNCTVHNIPFMGIRGYDDSYNITIGNTSAIATATVSSYSNEVYDCGYAGIRLTGCDPVTGHSHWDVYYNYIHDINIAGTSANSYGIAFTSELNGAGQGYSIGYPAYTTAQYNRVENNPKWTGISSSHDGTYIYIRDNYVYNMLTGITAHASELGGEPTPILENVYFERNIVENPAVGSAYGSCNFISISTDNLLYRPTNININDNICFFTSSPASDETIAKAIFVTHSDGVIIDGNIIYNGPTDSGSGAISIGGAAAYINKGVVIRNNWIYNWRYSMSFSGDVDGAFAVYNNIVHGAGQPLIGASWHLQGAFTMYNNDFLQTGGAVARIIDFQESCVIDEGATFTVKNNIFGYTVLTNGRYIFTPQTNDGTLTVDYNLYWNTSNTTSEFYLAGVAKTLTTWREAGLDVNSPNVTETINPLFTNGGGSYQLVGDFALGVGSPAINAGTDTGVTTDYYGNPRVGNYDIGAIEKQ